MSEFIRLQLVEKGHENARLQSKCDGYVKENEEVIQQLGRALGYPRFVDDQKNFPGATEADGVAVGEHVPVTLAIDVRKKIEQLQTALQKIRDLPPHCGRGACCGYVTKAIHIADATV